MKNLNTFEEFINESRLNEALEGPQKANAKKIGELTLNFLERDLPDLLSKYDCSVEAGTAVNKDDYFIRNTNGKDILRFATWNMGRNRFARLVAYLGTSFSSPINPLKKDLFLAGSPSEAESKSKGITKFIMGWQSGPYDFLDDSNSVKIYQDWIDALLKGMEENMKLLKSKNALS